MGTLTVLVDIEELRVTLDDIPAGTIRWWAHKGWITRRGKAGRCTLYDQDEVVRFAAMTRHAPAEVDKRRKIANT